MTHVLLPRLHGGCPCMQVSFLESHSTPIYLTACLRIRCYHSTRNVLESNETSSETPGDSLPYMHDRRSIRCLQKRLQHVPKLCYGSGLGGRKRLWLLGGLSRADFMITIFLPGDQVEPRGYTATCT